MIDSTPESLKELHHIREQIAKEEKGLSARDRAERVHRQADAFLKTFGLTLKVVSPPSRSAST
jgi:hypothetical protein